MLSQQLINGQIIITDIAKYSITSDHAQNVPKFEPCIDAYEQFVFMASQEKRELNPSFDHYGQLICLS